MLNDPEEIRIISQARQKNVRDPKRSRHHFVHIFQDFLDTQTFAGAKLLDIGPGQFDFAVMASDRGAVTHGIDSDPAVLALGRHKGLPVREGRIQDLKTLAEGWPLFDGVFCKLSVNAFWFWDDEQRHEDWIRTVGQLLRPGGWAWIAPWNGIPKRAELSADRVGQVLELQMAAFKALGFRGLELTESLSEYYGVHGTTANRSLFTLNLPWPTRVSRCQVL